MTLKKILYSGIASISLIGLLGCSAKEGINTDSAKGKYFGQVPALGQSGVTSVTGDFDNDGDLDVIVTTINKSRKGIGARSYFYENQKILEF